MSRVVSYVPRAMCFLAGVAVAAVTLPRRDRAGMDVSTIEELKKSVADLEVRMRSRDAAEAERFAQLEARIEEHSAKLADVPSTTQIVSAMEQLLSRTMASLDDRLTNQARTIEILKTTVSQTDNLLERVLESLDSLQTLAEPGDFSEDQLLHRPPV